MRLNILATHKMAYTPTSLSVESCFAYPRLPSLTLFSPREAHPRLPLAYPRLPLAYPRLPLAYSRLPSLTSIAGSISWEHGREHSREHSWEH